MNKAILLLSLFSLSLFNCGSNSVDLWNRTLKSSGNTILNYDAPVDANHNTSIIDFLRDNFNNINWENSGVKFDYSEGIIDYFLPEDYADFNSLKNKLDNWWDSDRQYGTQLTYYGLKNKINHLTIITNKKNLYDGTVNFHSDIVPDRPTDDIYLATDISELHDGSYLMLTKNNTDVGYVRMTNCRNIVNIRSGYNDDSMIQFTFTLKEPVDNLTVFHLNSYIEITNYHFVIPWWGTFLIVLGLVILAGGIYLIVKLYREHHHRY